VSIHYFRFTLCDTVDRKRSRLLEALLARADGSREAKHWRDDAFRILAPQASSVPGVGAAALCGQRGGAVVAHAQGASVHGTAAAGGTVFMATPVHYVAEMSNVRLPADGLLALERPEAEKLFTDFNRVWGDAGVRLEVGRRADLFCVMDQSLAATTRDPVDALGRHIESYLPTGEGAPRLRQLMSEIEMWLFDHAVNQNRSARAEPVVNGLWLWGGGAPLASLPRIEGWTAGDDPLFAAWAGGATAGAGESAGDGAGDGAGGNTGAGTASRGAVQASSGVAVIAAQPGTAEWQDMELNWLQPSLRALRSGRIERLDLSAGQRCFSVGSTWRSRFWRRQRPWWESFT
jgi:hypothetical protein